MSRMIQRRMRSTRSFWDLDLEPTLPPTLLKRSLARDFITHSLYHPTQGYFNQSSLQILHPTQPIDFKSLPSQDAFLALLAQLYSESVSQGKHVRSQLWHTPAELFQPFFGRALANYISHAHATLEPLVIYEIGTGNGTLMLDILDYIQEHAPHLYNTMEYHAIEISSVLVASLHRVKAKHPNVSIIQKSVLDWNTLEPRPCFLIAMEVIDNFAHDVVRYDNQSGKPFQGIVNEDVHGEFEEVYEEVTDPLIQDFLKVREACGHSNPLSRHRWKKRMRMMLPFAPNLSQKEFLPTQCFQFIRILKKYFPQHRLILSDFDQLPDTIPGVNGPVVQTMYHGAMVPCSTYLVQPGLFDIFFPTDFGQLKDMYNYVMCKDASRILSYHAFLSNYAQTEATRLKSGENPMLNFYKNASFLISS